MKKKKTGVGEKIYQKLKKQGLSDKEIAEAFVLPHDLTKKEKAKADKDLSKFLKKYRASPEYKKAIASPEYKKLVEKIKNDFKQ